MEVKNKLELLSKPVWTYRDIMAYYGYSKPTAIKAKNTAIKAYNGKVSYGNQYATIDSILELFGTNRITEIEKLKQMIYGEWNTKTINKANIDFDKVEDKYYEQEENN